MKQVFFTGIELSALVSKVAKETAIEVEKKLEYSNNRTYESKEFLEDYIPKSEVRGKLASSSTLHKYEKTGKLPVYSFGGKRFYKKSEITTALVRLNPDNEAA